MTVGTHSKTPTRVDWSLSGSGTTATTALAALGMVTAAAIGDVTEVNAIWGAAGAVAGAATSVLVGARHQVGPGAMLHRIGTWAGAGAWMTWALAATPWTTNGLVALIVGAGVAGGLSKAVDSARPDGQMPARAGGLVLRSDSRLAQEWQARLARVCRIVGAEVTDVRTWDTGGGYSLTVLLPAGGATRQQVAAQGDSLAADARLPEGCGVEVAAGPHRGSCVLHVATVNRLAATIDYPADLSPASILDPVGLGEFRDASRTGAPLRQLAGLVTGQRGSGKTTVLNVVTAEVAKCRDAIVWHLDLNGGGLSQAWLHPWLEGETERPAIDWAAANQREAVAMVEAAVAVAKDRKSAYRTLKVAANSSLLPISADLPEIVLIVDEGGEVLSPTARGALGTIRDGIEELQRIGRNEAVNVIVSSLRATQELIAVNVKKQSGLRIGMYVQDEEELNYLFGWGKNARAISTDDLTGPGCGFIQDDTNAPRPFKAWNMTPHQVTDAARTIAGRRPELDQASAHAAGEAYTYRHARMHLAFEDPTAAELAIPTPPPEAPTRHLSVVGSDATAWGDPRDLTPHTAPAPDNADVWADPRDVAAGRPARTVVTAVPATVPLLLRDIAALAGSRTRVATGEIVTELGLEMTATALGRLLRTWGAPSDRQQINGAWVRGPATADLNAAIDRIARGGPVELDQSA